MRSIRAKGRNARDLLARASQASSDKSRPQDQAKRPAPVVERYPGAARLAIVLVGSVLSWSALLIFMSWLL